MSDYDDGFDDERGPLARAFAAAIEHAMTARAALERRLDDPLEPAAQADELAAQCSVAARRLARDSMAWTGAAGEADITAAQYAFVVLLDELLLFSEWPGRTAWEALPLEMRVFGTHAGGERLPDAVESLLAQRDPSQRDLANVYLACLMLGFKGRLRGEAGALRHDQLRHALFAFAMQRDPEPARLAAPLERVAIGQGRAAELTQMFPDHTRLALLLGVGVCVLLGISHLIWSMTAAQIRPAEVQFRAVSLLEASPPPGGAAASGVAAPFPAAPGSGEAPQPSRDHDAPPQKTATVADLAPRTVALSEGGRP
ncbi:DotU family type IV/VI secretion system protein [Trinickia terrae]|nr:DotU family type IV/VI secretion system protein [Trinickia terrae]